MVIIGVLMEKYREARAESGHAVKPKSNENYILQRLHDAIQSNLASRLTAQQIVKFAQDCKRASMGNDLTASRTRPTAGACRLAR